MKRFVTKQGIYGPSVETPGERQRAESAQRVREARERLTSRTGTRPSFDREAMLLYARNQLGASLAIPLLGAVVAIVSTLWVPVTAALIWLCTVLISKGILMSLARQFENTAPDTKSLSVWSAKFTAAEFFYGITWAMLALIQTTSDDPEIYVFIFATLIIILAVRTMLAGSITSALYAGTLPITAALVLRFSLLGEVIYYAMAGIAVGAQIYFIVLGQRMATNVYKMLELRAQTDALIAELEQSKVISEEARRRAEAANIAKSRFLATMSHELRTPLNAILGFSEIMTSELMGAHSNPAYKEYAGDIHRSGQHLLNLINEILDVSRIEAGRYELNEEAIDLVAIVEDCQHLVSLRAREKNVTLVEQYERDMPKVWADARALRQVTLNLLSNAIKFTPSGGEITLRVGWTAGGGQYIACRDTGPGIPEEEIPVVLSSFGQGSLAQRTAEQGTGLGLPIVKGLIDLHGGSFTLNSKLRVGTEAIATLPRSRVMVALPPADELDGESTGTHQRGAA